MRTMMNLLYSIIGVIAFCAALLPYSVFASEVVFKVIPSNPVNNEEAIVEARIDPQGKDINAVEGIISLRSTNATDMSSVMVETGGSLLTLWAALPQYFPNEKVIRFVGGTPQGFNHEGPIFRIRILNSVADSVTISWIGGSAYLNDGKGTIENISSRSIVVSLAPHDTKKTYEASLDSMPPKFDVVEVGQDPSVHDGKYFVSFHATDDISGVKGYEIREGQELTSVVDGVYVLKNQDPNVHIFITAYDQAGNHTTIEFPSPYRWTKDGIIMLLFILFTLFTFIYGYKKITKK